MNLATGSTIDSSLGHLVSGSSGAFGSLGEIGATFLVGF
jgi:hypothetical protein